MEAQAEALAEALELAGDDPSAVLLDDNVETTSSALENDATSDASVQGTDEVAADADKTLEGEFVRNDNNEEENESVITTPLKTPETEAVMSPDTALAQEHEEEMLFRKHLLEKFAEDDRIEQMNAQRRRMKMEEHKREVQRLWEEKQARFNAQREAEMAEMAAALARDERRADIVEAERQRLLREHAARLAEYLPKGVLQYESDLALIGK